MTRTLKTMEDNSAKSDQLDRKAKELRAQALALREENGRLWTKLRRNTYGSE